VVRERDRVVGRHRRAGCTLIQQLVYPHGARRPTFCFADHMANRQKQSEFGVDHLEGAHVRSLCPHASVSTSLEHDSYSAAALPPFSYP
jgi:hypothetical protein